MVINTNIFVNDKVVRWKAMKDNNTLLLLSYKNNMHFLKTVGIQFNYFYTKLKVFHLFFQNKDIIIKSRNRLLSITMS